MYYVYTTRANLFQYKVHFQHFKKKFPDARETHYFTWIFNISVESFYMVRQSIKNSRAANLAGSNAGQKSKHFYEFAFSLRSRDPITACYVSARSVMSVMT